MFKRRKKESQSNCGAFLLFLKARKKKCSVLLGHLPAPFIKHLAVQYGSEVCERAEVYVCVCVQGTEAVR